MTRDHKGDTQDNMSHSSVISVVRAAKSFRRKSIVRFVQFGVFELGGLTSAGVGRAGQETPMEVVWG